MDAETDEHTQAEDLRRALADANLANELDLLLLGAGDAATLQAELPRFLVQRAQLDGVWLGHRGDDGRFQCDAVAGSGMEAYLEQVGAQLDAAPPAAGPDVLAWRSGQPQFIADWTTDARTQSCRAAGEQAGWRGAVSLPLLGPDGRRDLLTLYSRHPGFFQQVHNQRLVWHLYAVLGLKLGQLRMLGAMQGRGRLPQLLAAALEGSEIGVTLSEAHGVEYPLIYVNPAFTRLTGYAPEQALGRDARFLQGEQRDEQLAADMREALLAGRSFSVEVRNVRADGGVFWNALSLAPVRDDAGVVTHYLGLMSDVSARHTLASEHEITQGLYRALLAEEELVLGAADLSEMLQQSCDRLGAGGLFASAMVARAGRDGDIDMLAQAGRLQVSEEWFRPNVYASDGDASLAVRAWNSRELQYTNDYGADPELTMYREQTRGLGVRSVAFAPVLRGGHRWALLGVISERPGVFTAPVLELVERVARLIGYGLDAFDLRRRLQQEHRHISWLAEHDPLTGLLNRRGLRLRLDEALSQADAQGGLVAVGILDFDDFKQINDTYGHAAGDAMLRTIASRLVEAVRASDTVARLGGDEIVLVLQGLATREDLEPMLQRIRSCVDAAVPVSEDGAALRVRASIGMTLYPDDASEPDDLLRHADQALYAIKQQPRGTTAPFWRIYQPAVDRDHFTHLRLVRERFAAGGLRVHYQPVVDMITGRVVEVEALARLDDGNSRLIGPGDFVHQLGRDAQIVLTTAVLRHAINDAIAWQNEHDVELTVAVNIDPLLLASGEALTAVKDVTTELNFAPKRVVLEILEYNDFLSVDSAQETLAELRQYGCRIALDDVGSAYSSLLRVKELPIDIIKLDQAFIRGLSERPQDLRFVQSLAQLARGLGMLFVVEGAETDDIVEALRALRVPLAQGYGIARPMPAERFGAWLREWSARAQPVTRGLLTCVAEQLVNLDMDLLIARHYPEPKPPLTLSGDPAQGPVGRWLARSDLSDDHPLAHAYHELYAMFHDWLQAGPEADDSMLQSALDHLLRSAGEYLRAKP